MEQEIDTTTSQQHILSTANDWANRSYLAAKTKRRQKLNLSPAHITEKLNQLYAAQPSRLLWVWQRLQCKHLLEQKW